MYNKHYIQIRYNYPNNRWFLVEIGKNGPNFRLKLKNKVVLKMYERNYVLDLTPKVAAGNQFILCIKMYPRAKLPKYTYT